MVASIYEAHFMFYIILLYLGILFFIEVVLGSCVDVYNAEVGLAARCEKLKQLSPKQFFTQLLPFIILSAGLPLLLSAVF
jgi:hypothetical protein